MTGDIDTAVTFLEAWDAVWLLTAIKPDTRVIETQFFADIETVRDWLEARVASCNIYFSGNRTRPGLKSKAAKSDITETELNQPRRHQDAVAQLGDRDRFALGVMNGDREPRTGGKSEDLDAGALGQVQAPGYDSGPDGYMSGRAPATCRPTGEGHEARADLAGRGDPAEVRRLLRGGSPRAPMVVRRLRRYVASWRDRNKAASRQVVNGPGSSWR